MSHTPIRRSIGIPNLEKCNRGKHSMFYLRMPTLSLALFLCAGYVKGDPRFAFLPIDLTLVCAVIVSANVLSAIIRHGMKVPKTVFATTVVYLAFLVPLAWTEWTPYAASKVTRLFTLTLLSTVGPQIIVDGRCRIRSFMNALTVIGIIMSIDSLVNLYVSGQSISRLTAFGSNTIALGRSAGLALIWVMVCMLEGQTRPFFGMVTASLLLIALMGAGSRGPFFGAVAIVVLLILERDQNFLRFAWRILLAVALMFGISFAIARLPALSVARLRDISGVVHGSASSVAARWDHYRLASELIPKTPSGVGWGGFLNLLGVSGTDAKGHVHNIILEIFLEAGWIAGVLFVAMLMASIFRAYQSRGTVEGRAVWSILLFLAINAMVSGDINDNRLLFAFIGIGLRCNTTTGKEQ